MKKNEVTSLNIIPDRLSEEMSETLEMVYDVHEVIGAMLRGLSAEERQGRAASALRIADSQINTIIIRMDPEVRGVRNLEQNAKE